MAALQQISPGQVSKGLRSATSHLEQVGAAHGSGYLNHPRRLR